VSKCKSLMIKMVDRKEIFDLRPSSNLGDARRITCITQAVLHWLEKHKGLNIEKAIAEFGHANARYLIEFQKEETKRVEKAKRADAKIRRKAIKLAGI